MFWKGYPQKKSLLVLGRQEGSVNIPAPVFLVGRKSFPRGYFQERLASLSGLFLKPTHIETEEWSVNRLATDEVYHALIV